MLRELGIPDRRISLTPFVVDNDWWIERSSRTDRAAIRADWGASEADLVVLYCAKLQGWKRPLDLLRAFAKADIPNSILVYAGEGPLRPEIENEATALGVGGRIRLLGFTNQSRLPAIYSSADLFVLPSDYDPCPVVVCEAMLCGLPVILSDKIAGRFDLVEAGITGDVYPCGDIDALASSLGKMLSDRTTLRVLAASARARIETWSPDRNVVATVEAVAAAVSHRTRRRVGGVAAPKSVGKRNWGKNNFLTRLRLALIRHKRYNRAFKFSLCLIFVPTPVTSEGRKCKIHDSQANALADSADGIQTVGASNERMAQDFANLVGSISFLILSVTSAAHAFCEDLVDSRND
jgi:hypothetical protein